MKKSLAVILALLLGASMCLAACRDEAPKDPTGGTQTEEDGGNGGNGGGDGGNGGGGGGDDVIQSDEIVISLFASNADEALTQKIADAWVTDYNAANGTKYTVKIDNFDYSAEYYNKLPELFDEGDIGDIMYLLPNLLKTYAKTGRIIDLTQYIAGDAELEANVAKLWPNALNYYGFDASINAFTGDTYTMGQSILYNRNGASGAGFYTEAGNKKVGLYGLPAYYTNFAMGYNRLYFTEEMKQAYLTTKVDAERTVWAPRGDKNSNSTGKTNGSANTGTPDGNANVQYTAETGVDSKHNQPVIRYAVSGDGFSKNDAANIINPGIPVKIKPFNFYMWADYKTALDAGDPIATLAEWATDGDGYTMTIPGFPDEEFTITDNNYINNDAPYDATKGHMVYTYAEYGALLWSLTYYLNTFAWDQSEGTNNHIGGTIDSTGDFRTVYGGEQYEGGAQDGAQLYLLPWLFSNDADFIDVANKKCTQATTDLTDATGDWTAHAGNLYDTVKKLRLNGTKEDVQVQYGLNSKNFIEAYAAFLAVGSDWNGNPNDSPAIEKESSGWGYFREGRTIFYGAGSWDAAVRNEEDLTKVDAGEMAMPVAEKYALYSYIKDANYNMVSYANTGSDPDHGTAAVVGRGDAPTAPFTREQVEQNLLYRQDKWGGSMNSVGYAVTCKSLSTGKPGGKSTAKTKAAASLCAALTVSEQSQIAFTYGGTQLPNFVSQCKDLLHFQDAGYEQGAFKDMITPDGSATVKNIGNSTAGTQLWNEYYEIAKAMGNEANSRDSGGQTVAEYLADKKVNGEPVKYNLDYADVHLNRIEFAKADGAARSRYSFAMRVLNMISYRRSDIDLFIRMQCGLNGVRDSTIYTYNDEWLDPHDARNKYGNHLCYYCACPITYGGRSGNFDDETFLKRTTTGKFSFESKTFLTPFVWCIMQASEAQANLQRALQEEIDALTDGGVTA